MKVVKIGSLACMSCIVMDQIFDKVKSDYDFEFVSYDYDFDEDKVKEFDLGKTLPVYIFYNGEKEIGRIIGEKSEKEFRKEIERFINEEN